MPEGSDLLARVARSAADRDSCSGSSDARNATSDSVVGTWGASVVITSSALRRGRLRCWRVIVASDAELDTSIDDTRALLHSSSGRGSVLGLVLSFQDSLGACLLLRRGLTLLQSSVANGPPVVHAGLKSSSLNSQSVTGSRGRCSYKSAKGEEERDNEELGAEHFAFENRVRGCIEVQNLALCVVVPDERNWCESRKFFVGL